MELRSERKTPYRCKKSILHMANNFCCYSINTKMGLLTPSIQQREFYPYTPTAPFIRFALKSKLTKLLELR